MDGIACILWVFPLPKECNLMKIVWDVIGVLLILLGAVWFLQGAGVLMGNMMSGQIQWAIIGGIAVLVGAGLLLYVNRRRSR